MAGRWSGFFVPKNHPALAETTTVLPYQRALLPVFCTPTLVCTTSDVLLLFVFRHCLLSLQCCLLQSALSKRKQGLESNNRSGLQKKSVNYCFISDKLIYLYLKLFVSYYVSKVCHNLCRSFGTYSDLLYSQLLCD